MATKLNILDKFSVTPNSLISNPEISFKAKGLFAYIQSKPDNWDFSVRSICAESREGRDSVSEGLKELISAGYLRRTKHQEENGHFVVEYTLYHTPTFSDPFTENPSTEPEKPFTGNPLPENPLKGKPVNKRKKVLHKKVLSKKVDIVDSLFFQFFSLFPVEKRKNKPAAFKAWQKLTEEEMRKAISDVPLYLLTVEEVKFVKLPSTYLNQESYNEERETLSPQLKKNATNNRVDPKYQIKSY